MVPHWSHVSVERSWREAGVAGGARARGVCSEREAEMWLMKAKGARMVVGFILVVGWSLADVD